MTAVRLLTLGLVVALTGFATADDKEKKADENPLVGTWSVTGGKKAGAALGDDAKKGKYVITKDEIQIMGMGDKALFVIKYTTDMKKTPATIDMEITGGEMGDGAKGTKAKGIVEVKDGVMKFCYDSMGGDRPTKFDGDKWYNFELKKEKKDK